MKNLISKTLTAEEKSNFLQHLDEMKGILNFAVNLTKEEKKKLRKLGAIRTGYVQNVYNAGMANSSVLAASFNKDEYTKDYTLHKEMLELFARLQPFYESFTNTMTLLGSELMGQSDEVYGFLKLAAKKGSDQALNSTVKAIADQLKQEKKAAKKANE